VHELVIIETCSSTFVQCSKIFGANTGVLVSP